VLSHGLAAPAAETLDLPVMDRVRLADTDLFIEVEQDHLRSGSQIWWRCSARLANLFQFRPPIPNPRSNTTINAVQRQRR